MWEWGRAKCFDVVARPPKPHLGLWRIMCLSVYSPTPPETTLTVENVIGVMEKVTDDRAVGVWRSLLFGEHVFEDINSKCSTERELMHTCADIYVNCDLDSSWEGIALGLYRKEETAAVEEVRSYLNPRGRCCQWVWFVHIYYFHKGLLVAGTAYHIIVSNFGEH